MAQICSVVLQLSFEATFSNAVFRKRPCVINASALSGVNTEHLCPKTAENGAHRKRQP